MFTRVAQHAVRRSASFRPAVFRASPAVASFSTAELVPGVGYGKTSTGIVSSTSDAVHLRYTLQLDLQAFLTHFSLFPRNIPCVLYAHLIINHNSPSSSGRSPRRS